MARRTRLYQRAQSPLIQGQSKRERPWWQPVTAAFCASLGLIFFLWWLLAVLQGVAPLEAIIVFASGIPGILLRSIPGAIIGSIGGVAAARVWGSVRPWIVGAALGSVLAGAGLLFFL
jgi:hypothetical protein